MSIQAQLTTTAAAAAAAGAATTKGSAGTAAGKSPIEEEAATHSEASAKGTFLLAHHLMPPIEAANSKSLI